MGQEKMGMGYHYRAQYEFILFLEKGNKPWNPCEQKTFHGTKQLKTKSISDIFPFQRIKRKDAYPTEKPVELMKVLIENSSNELDLIIDPFLGSGSVAIASSELNRNFHGCDISQSAIDYCNNRIKKSNKV